MVTLGIYQQCLVYMPWCCMSNIVYNLQELCALSDQTVKRCRWRISRFRWANDILEQHTIHNEWTWKRTLLATRSGFHGQAKSPKGFDRSPLVGTRDGWVARMYWRYKIGLECIRRQWTPYDPMCRWCWSAISCSQLFQPNHHNGYGCSDYSESVYIWQHCD